ncbi:MAG: phytanoyl-CoA dioxygenase family protein [Planctomycetes bacterium]|nr:phytanoyl-CoA dioxygenase family protein [Planctomycetota bacterium]
MSSVMTMERDMRFVPIPADRKLSALTSEQVAAYNRDGFIAPVRLFDGAEAARNRSDFDHLLAAYQSRGHDSYAVNSCQATCGSVYDLVTNPRITALVGDILGDEFACWGTHYFCKLPHHPKTVAWHQDAPYWPFSRAKTVTVWLAIDDVDLENAAMRVIPGSHLVGALPMRNSRPEENNALWLTVDDAERQGAPVPLILKAGEASLQSDMLLHGSPANPSARRRCGLTLRYCTLDVRADEGWHERSIIIRGSDPSGHWGGVTARPAGEDPFLDGRPIGAN